MGTVSQRTPAAKQTNGAERTLSAREGQARILIPQRMCERLGISVRTVEVHRRNTMDKIGARNAAQMIKFAVEHGLI